MYRMSKNGLIQIPNVLIANKDIKPNTTYLYLMMKLKANQLPDNTFMLNMYSYNFLEYIKWTQPTFMKHLKILHSLGMVIDYKIEKFKPIKIHLEEMLKASDKQYTQIDRFSIDKILNTADQIETKSHVEQAIRLYYYYEDKYNQEKGYSYPTFQQIVDECRISKSTITTLNKYFKKQKLLHIIHGQKWYIDEQGRPRKENNRYIPLCKDRKG